MTPRLLRSLFTLAIFISCASCSTPAGLTPPKGCDGMCACATDTDCKGATPHCDKNSGNCVVCLPLNDDCPKGQRCVAQNNSFVCSASCTTDADCPKSDAGGQLVCCNAACIDTGGDTKNCGGCGKTCPSLANASSICVTGVCALGACNGGFADCDNVPTNGCEANTASDGKNCGGCGKGCAAGGNSTATCASGSCNVTCAMGFADCDKNAANGCEVNTQSDLANCGGCGTPCGMLANSQSTCVAGVCSVASCNMGFADCDHSAQNGCEVNTGTDIANCGACGKACATPNGVAACKSGICGIGSCNMGFSDCDGIAANGCEKPVATDPNNCGACGHVCAGTNSMQGCVASSCTIMACTQGFADCDMNAANGCEVGTSMDIMNCGGCGKTCPTVQNGTSTCTNAVCGVGGCKFGYAHCTMNPMDGCETNIASDIKNCGQCGNTCPMVTNGTPGCKTGMCGIATCSMLFGDCDGNPNNGCEKSLATDVNNCGACGKVCNFANATGACLNGQCGITQCNQGFADCDGNAANGCEANVNTDANNCGKCGMACPMNMALCGAGVCSAVPPCSNGSVTDCNAQGTTLITQSAFVDPQTPQGWTQCAGFINTAGDDVTDSFLNNCLSTSRLRIRVYTINNVVEEDIIVTNQMSSNSWPNFNYLGGNPQVLVRTRWGSTGFFTTTDGRDACAQQAAPGGITFGTGNGSVAIIAGRNVVYDEYRVSCGGMNLPDRKIALYK